MMNTTSRLLLILSFSCFFFTACEVDSNTVERVEYFDIEEYVTNFLKNQTNTFDVEKTVALNGEYESKTLKAYDISKELEMMKKFNINKASLSGKYEVSTINNESSETTIYTALEESLFTRTLTVTKEKNVISQIKIEGLRQSILSESKQTVIFAPEKSFQLISEDNNRYSKDLEKEILLKF